MAADLEKKARRGYASSPWRFTGRALYQMHLVKADTARRYIPAELKLVEAFGYTLGGFYLAHYDDSPVGPFDELVVIAGIVWNPPTSCAWAARVLVNDRGACAHGIQEVGLPSRFASFSHTVSVMKGARGSHPERFKSEVHEVSISRERQNPWCRICMPYSLMKEATAKGPPLKFSLPSFSGNTKQQPNLLKYTCNLTCRVAMSKPASVSTPEERRNEHLDSDVFEILSSKPMFAVSFDDMTMAVKAPTLLMSTQRAVKKNAAG